jgi:alpha-ribazole phosphatase
MSGDGRHPIACVRIDLLRHGHTGERGFRGQLDDPPSAQGLVQMRASVAGGQWDAAVSSPLQRCAMFARGFADANGMPLKLEPRLAEYRFGDWQGVPLEVLAQAQGEVLARFWAEPDLHPPPGAETLACFGQRVLAALDDVAAGFPGRRVLVVTHGGVIRWLLCRLRGLPWSEMSGLEVPHASMHRLDWPQAEGGQG